MATAAIPGFNGSISIGGAVSEGRNINITLECDTYDASSYDSGGNKEAVAGLKGGNGTFEALVTPTIARGFHAAAAFAVAGGESYSGAIIIQSVVPAAPVDGIANYSYTFMFTGAINITL